VITTASIRLLLTAVRDHRERPAAGDLAVTTELAFVSTPSRETPTGQATGWLSGE